MRRWHTRLLFSCTALLAGIFSIIFAIGAESAIEYHQHLLGHSMWLTLIIAPGGFALLAWLARRFFPGTEGSGIPQAIAASMTEDRRIRRQLLSFRIAVAKVLLTLGGLLCGASVGREGPSIQVSASIMHLLAGKGKRIASTHDLIAAGSGAGIAAAFNTPLGGIMFAIEEMCRNRSFRANSSTLTAVIFAGLISLAVLGNYTYFGRTPVAVVWPDSLWPVILSGLVGGLAGGGFSRILIASARGLPGQFGLFATSRPIIFAAACGLATAIIGLITGGRTYGTGYGEIKAALEGIALLPVYFFFAKILTVWIAFISRIPGGIFAPSLAVGAGLGSLVALFFPETPQSAPILLCMVAFLSAMTQTPITSFVILMEMTANHEMLLPLMAASVISYGVSKTIAPVPLYQALAYRTLRRAEALVHAKQDASSHSQAMTALPESIKTEAKPSSESQ